MNEQKLENFFSDSFMKRIKNVIEFDNLNDLTYVHSRVYNFEQLCKLLISFLEKNPEVYGSKAANNHYTTCVWARPDVEDGPGTCMCCYIAIDKQIAERRLMNIEEANISYFKQGETGSIHFPLNSSAALNFCVLDTVDN